MKKRKDGNIMSFFEPAKAINQGILDKIKKLYLMIKQKETKMIFSGKYIKTRCMSYQLVIKNYIDLEILKNNINSNKYPNLSDFAVDVDLLFCNCFQYFHEKSEEYQYVKLIQISFQEMYSSINSGNNCIQNDALIINSTIQETDTEILQNDSDINLEQNQNESLNDNRQRNYDIEEDLDNNNNIREADTEILQNDSDINLEQNQNESLNDNRQRNYVVNEDATINGSNHGQGRNNCLQPINLQNIRMRIDHFYSENELNEPPKIYINQNTFLTRINPKKPNKKTLNLLSAKNAMGFFTVISNGQHSKYRCSVALCHNGVFYQCTEQARYDQIDDFILTHIDHKFEVCFQMQTTINFRPSFSSSFQATPYQNIINLLSFVVSCDSVPLNKVNDDIFYNLLLSAIRLGQTNPNVQANQLLPHYSTATIRSQIIELANRFREEIYSQYRSFSHIGMVIDAGTVNSFHFIDFCLTIPSAKDSFNGKPLVIPFNYKTCFIKSASVENIQREVINSIIDLRTKGLNITSVTADNIPTQVLALAQWSKHSIMRSDSITNKDLKRIIHSACAAHTINLVAKSIKERNVPEFIKKIYQNFEKVVTALDICSEIGLPIPPKNVQTRWLTVMYQFIYLRKYDIYFTGYSNDSFPTNHSTSFLLDEDDGDIDVLGINYSDKQDIYKYHLEFIKCAHNHSIDTDLFSPYNFRNYMYLAKVLWPLYQAILYFEKDQSSLVSIYPILMQIQEYWDNLLQYFESKVSEEPVDIDQGKMSPSDYEGWKSTIDYLRQQLEFRKFHTFDWPMLVLAYCFTPAGRNIYRTKIHDAGFTIFDDFDLNNDNSSIDFKLFTTDYFGNEKLESIDENSINQSDQLTTNNLNSSQNIQIINNQFTVSHFQPNDNNAEISNNKRMSLEGSDVWIFPANMMSQPSSILFLDDPWREPNGNHSINGKKLAYNHRPMADLEFQYQPFHPNLINATLYEMLKRLQYDEYDIDCAKSAFEHYISSFIGDNGLNIKGLYNCSSVREMWLKIRSNFYNNKRGNNTLSHGYLILSDLALTLISCSASEAQCERFISSQKLSISKNTRNINDEYLESIWFLASHRKQIMNYFSQ